MSLTIVGRKNLAATMMYSPVQDPDNMNKFYFIMRSAPTDTPASSLCLYSIVWGGDPIILANLNTYLPEYDGATWKAGTVAKNLSLVDGYLDETPHFAIGFSDSTPTGTGIVEVNTSTGAVTVVYPYSTLSGTYDGAAIGDRITRFQYTVTGTQFYINGFVSAQYGASKYVVGFKVFGTTGKGYGTLNESTTVGTFDWTLVDEINNKIYGPSGANWRGMNMGNFTWDPGLYSGVVLYPEHTAVGIYIRIDWNDGSGSSSVPALRRVWDDNWLYGFGIGIKASPYDAIYFRKNLITGQYQYTAFTGLALASVGIGNALLAFDIWQNEDDESSRRIFFGVYSSGYLYTSKAWPGLIDSSVLLDTGAGANITVLSVHTAGEYVYVFHFGGSTEACCLTKVHESDLVPAATEPSIGGIGARILFKDKRVFFIGVPNYGKYLWWGQPLEPQALDVGWDGFNTTVFDDEDNTSINVLDDNLYIGSQKGFIRLRGKSPDSWVLDQTLATTGPLSDKTSSVTPFGLVYPRENGLWLFNGFTSVLFFEKGKNLLNNVNWDQYARAFSLWDGRYYRLYYPSGTATENDRELVVDLIGGIENARGTEGDRAATFGFADLTTNTVYLGDASGNLMTLGGTAGSRAFSLTTKEYPVAGLLAAGTFSALHYDIDLAGATLSIIPICDGVEYPAKTITNTKRTRSKVSLPDGNFYRVGFRFEITTAAAVKFYDPWYLV